jgi:AraC-like DNA-binding protein
MPDARSQQAREQHRRSLEAIERAAAHRAQRDRLIRQLREEDPQRWTYPALAAAVGCSPELVAAIVKGRSGSAGS